MLAFHDDPELKAKLIESVRSRWEDGKLLPLPVLKFDAGRDLKSLAGELAGGEDREKYESITGIPVDLALMCETIVGAGIEMTVHGETVTLSGSPEVMQLGLEWLEAIKPGTDLAPVIPAYIVRLLEAILAPDFAMADVLDADVRSAGDAILELWRREEAGETIPHAEWRPVRTAAVNAGEAIINPWGHTIATAIEGLAWPLDSLASEFISILRNFLVQWLGYVRQSMRTEHEQADQVLVLTAWRRLSKLNGVSDPSELDAHFTDMPDALRAMRAANEPEVRAKGKEVDRKARVVTDPVIIQQMNVVINLIRQA